MPNSAIFIATEAIPLASLPDCKTELRKGETTYRCTVTASAAFSAAQIAACVIGEELTIGLSIPGGMLNFVGTVHGFGCRAGYSTVQITEAAAAFVPEELN